MRSMWTKKARAMRVFVTAPHGGMCYAVVVVVVTITCILARFRAVVKGSPAQGRGGSLRIKTWAGEQLFCCRNVHTMIARHTSNFGDGCRRQTVADRLLKTVHRLNKRIVSMFGRIVRPINKP